MLADPLECIYMRVRKAEVNNYYSLYAATEISEGVSMSVK